ncbi:hypothetical protein Q765_15055 [Flavobacterium rivuli WB 3.3-2 = DSM 21788]|uniref:Uncharacterized protein n=1 Tax=Flavobacterium rivuli WB 3.3-2 = DSM 21788 TaxID=1121895 RepID=A0A0A2M0G1_9FLAO|nr:hypothetical protein [Flavobacterium rivuli]KGO85734.1 hypothetical protein Q765_15055 [Flavobacterium rivuli WB 3.3-2 = DSM 21788]
MDILNDLIQKRNNLLKQVEAINLVLNLYDHKEGYEFKSGLNEIQITDEISSHDFPRNARKEKQILWIFENVLKKGSKINDVQDNYNALTGTAKNKQIKITNIVRHLKRSGELSAVKYNNQNRLCFYGLPYWIQGNDYKHEYQPNQDLLPVIVSSEIIAGDQTL